MVFSLSATLALRFLLPDMPSGVRASQSISRGYRLSLYLLTIAGIIFRSEIALLLATTTVYTWFRGRISLRGEIIPAGIFGILIGLLITVSADSFLWQEFPLWPELAAFKFNVLSGQSSVWGTQPWHFYFSNALPRLLLNPLTYVVGIPISVLLPTSRQVSASLLIPSFAYIAIYSLQPHKEWRFIIYVIPPLTSASALGASYVWTHRTKSLIYRCLSLAFVLSTISSFIISNFILLPISATNYPGAHALNAVHDRAHNTQPRISVYMDNLACQTGITRFMEFPPPAKPLVAIPGSKDGRMPTLRSGSSRWIYDKTEDENVKRSADFWDKFDFALVENTKQIRGRGRWMVVDKIKGFGGVKVLRPTEEGSNGNFEAQFAKSVMGNTGLKAWESLRSFGRKYVTGGWWIEVQMVPKIKIAKQIR